MNDKKLKIVLPISIILIITFFVIGFSSLYKMIIFYNMFEKMGEKISLENYYMKMISKEDTESNIEIFYKDGIGKILTSNGSYTWTDGKEAYLVIEENKTIYKLDEEAPGLISREAVGSMLPGYSKNMFGRCLLAGKITTSIKTENVGNFSYYKIKTMEDNKEKIIWINKETMIPSEIKLKTETQDIYYQYEITFEGVKNIDVEKPNLELYTLIENAEEK